MKSAYVPDLSTLHLLGELNFRRIKKLIRTEEERDQWCFVVPAIGTQESLLELTVLNQSPYTTQLSCSFGQRKAPDLLFDHTVKMTICLYHDVKIAEITDGHRQYKGVYPYPNDGMLHRDEKMRLNQQLADLLELCLKHGYRQEQSISYFPA